MFNAEAPIYMIPGWGFYSNVFQYSELNELPYLGLDYFNEEDLSIEGIARSLSKRIQNCSTLLGWSLGGLIAIKLAYLFPDKVKQLVLLESQPRFLEDVHWTGISRKVTKQFIHNAKHDYKNLKTRYIDLVNYPNHHRKHKTILEKNHIIHSEKILVELLKALFRADLRHEYQSVNSKILHIMGNKDSILNQNAHQLRRLNSSVVVVNIDNAGHAGFLSHCKIYKSIIRDFINHE